MSRYPAPYDRPPIRLKDVLLLPFNLALATVLITWPALIGILLAYPFVSWWGLGELGQIIFLVVTIFGYGWWFIKSLP